MPACRPGAGRLCDLPTAVGGGRGAPSGRPTSTATACLSSWAWSAAPMTARRAASSLVVRIKSCLCCCKACLHLSHFHRNCMSEFMGMLCGFYDGKEGGWCARTLSAAVVLHRYPSGRHTSTATACPSSWAWSAAPTTARRVATAWRCALQVLLQGKALMMHLLRSPQQRCLPGVQSADCEMS